MLLWECFECISHLCDCVIACSYNFSSGFGAGFRGSLVDLRGKHNAASRSGTCNIPSVQRPVAGRLAHCLKVSAQCSQAHALTCWLLHHCLAVERQCVMRPAAVLFVVLASRLGISGSCQASAPYSDCAWLLSNTSASPVACLGTSWSRSTSARLSRKLSRKIARSGSRGRRLVHQRCPGPQCLPL